MNWDDKVYCLKNPLTRGKTEAMGVKLLDRADYLVGIYLFWNSSRNPRRFLEGIVRDFGEARLYALDENAAPGLVCKMSIDVPSLVVLPECSADYHRIRLDLLEMRASNPQPFLALHYDFSKRRWQHHPLLALRCVDSNYSYIPN